MKMYRQVIVVVLTVNSASADEHPHTSGHDRILPGEPATLADLPEAPTTAVNDADVLVGEFQQRDVSPATPQNAADHMIFNEIHNVPNDEINELISALIRNGGVDSVSR
jgi:hypothetical protein